MFYTWIDNMHVVGTDPCMYPTRWLVHHTCMLAWVKCALFRKIHMECALTSSTVQKSRAIYGPLNLHDFFVCVT